MMWKKMGITGLVLVGGVLILIGSQFYLGSEAVEATGLRSLPLAEASALAGREAKGVLVNLAAIWCPRCRSLDRQVLADAEVRSAINGRYVFCRIEYGSDEGKAFRETYSINAFPALLILDSAGKLLKKLPITDDPAVFRKSLEW